MRKNLFLICFMLIFCLILFNLPWKAYGTNRTIVISDETRIKMVLSRLSQYAQRKDEAHFIANLSKNYFEKKNKNYSHAKVLIKDFFVKYEPWKNRPLLYIYDPQVEIKGNTAFVRCRVFLYGCTVNERRKFMQFINEKASFKKEKEGWKVTKFERLFDVLRNPIEFNYPKHRTGGKQR